MFSLVRWNLKHCGCCITSYLTDWIVCVVEISLLGIVGVLLMLLLLFVEVGVAVL